MGMHITYAFGSASDSLSHALADAGDGVADSILIGEVSWFVARLGC